MQDIIDKIIEIDSKAYELKRDTEKVLTNNEQNLREKLKTVEIQKLENAKVIADNKYNQLVKEGQELANNILKESDERCKKIEDRFLSIYSQMAKNIVKDIINKEIKSFMERK